MKQRILVFCCLFVCSKILAQTQLISIGAGTYLPLYSLDTQKVAVAPFKIDNYAVSNAEFLEFVRLYPEWQKSKAKRLFVDANYLRHWTNDTHFDPAIANQPVVNISWFAAKKYCECQGKRLPNTAEWELVAQASQKEKNGYKDEKFNQWLLEWVAKPPPKNKNRGSTFKNVYGVYDMHGLVWEWTHDYNSALTTGESRENGGLDSSLFCGGGSFSSKDVRNYAAFLRFAMRSSLKAKYGVGNLGFRCAQ